jgi:hypothetical protein
MQNSDAWTAQLNLMPIKESKEPICGMASLAAKEPNLQRRDRVSILAFFKSWLAGTLREYSK